MSFAEETFDTEAPLTPDRDQLESFVALVFKHASRDGFVALRAFDDVKKGGPPLIVTPIRIGDPNFLDTLFDCAAMAARSRVPAVFCPPVCTFHNAQDAKGDNLAEGVTLSVECDEHVTTARLKLERLLGPATAVVESGGQYSNAWGELVAKVHLHWRLKKTAASAEEHELLKEARRLAAELVGADTSAVPIVHPMRWPGSWHRKGEPRLARTVATSENEIELEEALALLRDAAGEAEAGDGAAREGNRKLRADNPGDIILALAAIPNPNVKWDEWNRIGMATWAASDGDEIGRQAFHDWSAKSTKYDHDTTEKRWKHFRTSPPNQIGMGTLVYLARVHKPNWNAGGLTKADFLAHLPDHSYIFTPTGTFWGAAGVNACLPPIPLFDKQGNPKLHAKGKKKGEPETIPAAVWLDWHQPVHHLTWAPGHPPLIRDHLVVEGGWIKRNKVATFNFYRPPIIEPGDPNAAGPWIKHVEKVYPDGAEAIFDFLAHCKQHPEIKINHALFMGGAPGIGKDSLLAPAKYAVGPWNFKEISPPQLFGQFNGFLKAVILRVNEVRDLGEFNRFQFYEHSKQYFAEPPEGLRVDEKNTPEYYVVNVVATILTSNHLTGGIYLPEDDRRHHVLWSQLTEADFDKDYWNRLHGWYCDGGTRHVTAFLATRNLSKFDPKAPPPKTEAFWTIVNANRAPEEGELHDALDTLGNPPAVTLDQVRDAVLVGNSDFYRWLEDRRNRRAIPHRFEQVGYTPVRNPANKGLWVVGRVRQTVYAKADLTEPERFAAVTQLQQRIEDALKAAEEERKAKSKPQ